MPGHACSRGRVADLRKSFPERRLCRYDWPGGTDSPVRSMMRLRPTCLSSAGLCAGAALVLLLPAAVGWSQHQVDWRSDLYTGTDLRQSDSARVGDEWRLRPLEQGIDDVSALGVSLRLLESGILMPTGFSEVYPVPGRPGWFMRVSGGVYAVFPKSVYTQQGAMVPDGAVFHIGPPEFLDQSLAQQQASPSRAPTSDVLPYRLALMRAQPMTPYASAPESATEAHFDDLGAISRVSAAPDRLDAGPPIVRDPAYREQRLLALMREAASRSSVSDRDGQRDD